MKRHLIATYLFLVSAMVLFSTLAQAGLKEP